MTPTFVHLHLHSEYSLTDSTLRIGPLVARCAELGLPAVAVTDTSNLFALVKFFKAAEGAGLKPIAGADLWVAEDGQAPARVTVLCLDRDGFLGLSRLVSRAYLEGHRGDQVVVRPDWLLADDAGLVLLAGRESPVGQLLAAGRREQADALLARWSQVFADRLYLELTRTQRAGEDAFNRAAVELALAHGLPLVASNDVRFLERADFEAHEARVCIATGRVLDDPKRPREYSPEQYLKSPEEMAALFADLPEALQNTVELAKRCNFELQLGTYYLPDFPVPTGYTLSTWIGEQARAGLARRLDKHGLMPGATPEDYASRLDTELGVIDAMGFPGYFLIVADFINWGKANDIPVGPGRGSGAGSLVAWALGITDLDPLRYDLLFERFLNPERVSMPDFDIDFCMDRRDEVIDYVAHKYGRDKVSQIITYGTMAAKAVVRDTGRVLGHPYGFVDSIAKLIPMTLGIGLDDALGLSPAAKKDPNLASSELIARYRDEDEVRDLIDLARKLEDLTRNAGKHAGGVVIAPSPLTNFSPLFAEHVGKGETARSIVTQFDKDDVEAIGLVKFDFLGLRTLTIIDWAVKAINAKRAAAGGDEPPLDILALPLDDAKTYRLLSKGLTTAVFQFESRGMKDYIRKLEPEHFEDLIALAALFRPGPLGAGMVDDFINRRHGRAEVSYPHPLLEPILKPTYGVIVYQEQVMQIAQVLAGYSLGGADLLRRAMGKKKPEEMAKERFKFEDGAARNQIPAAKASAIFDLMEKFADYGFNKSHSAAYALVAYQTAWLKAHYPAEFMAATLSSDMDNTDKVVNFLEDARGIGLSVLPPDANASGHMFEALDAKTIRYGLGAVKGVGRGACEAIVEARRGGPFRDLLDFCQRVDATRLNKRVLEALIQAGALDSLGANRASLMLQVPEAMRATEQLAREREAGQSSLFGGGALPEIRIELPTAPDWGLEQKLAGERETLGHFLSGHPLDPWRAELAELVGCTLGDLERIFNERRNKRGEAEVVLAGLVTQVRRRGDNQAFVQLEDTRGRIEVAFFSEAFNEFAPMLSRDRIVVVEGGLREDSFNGGFSLRARQCWDFRALCTQYGRRLALTVDLRAPGSWERLQQAMAPYRPGGTPLRLDLLTAGSRGIVELNGANSVRTDAELLNALRALPGVSQVSLALHRPWSA